MRRAVGLMTAGLFTALVLTACSAASGEPMGLVPDRRPSADAQVATVDGLAVVVGEVERELRRSRGSGSADHAADRALERVVAIKVQQAMLLREGVIETADFSSYLSGAAQENARREAALRKGEAVYGPTNLDPDYYFGYRFDTGVVALKERLEAGELRADEAELRAYYESVKERFFSQGWEITADVLTFPRADGDAEQRAGDANRSLRAGESVAAVARALAVDPRRERFVVEVATRLGEQVDQVTAALAGLRPHEVSDVLDTDEGFVVVKSIAERHLGFTSFEQNKERVRSLLLDQKYEELIQRQVRQAEVDVDNDVLVRIPPQ